MTLIDIKLSQRKREILISLVENYIRRAEPISSSYLEKFFDMSSATIRNELRELTELGFLEQTHSMSGRAPTSKAYRLYVDSLITRLILDRREVRALYRTFRRLHTELSALISAALDKLTEKSNYLAYMTIPSKESIVIKSVYIIEIDFNQVVILAITDGGVFQSKILETEIPVRKMMLGIVNERLNNYLRGKKLSEVNLRELKQLVKGLADRIPALYPRLEELFKKAGDSFEKVAYTEAYVLLSQPEFTDKTAFTELIETIKDQDSFIDIIKKSDFTSSVDALIGEETGKKELRNASILVSKYTYKDSDEGKLGVIGPKRLDYGKMIPIVFNVAEALSMVLTNKDEKKDKD